MVVNILNEVELKPFWIKHKCEKRDPVVYKQISILFDDDGNLTLYEGEEPETHTVSYDEKPDIQAIATTSSDIPLREGNGPT